MIFSLLVASPLLVVPVKDTVWWNTPSGTVMEHRDNTRANCTLALRDQDASVVFDWGALGGLSVTAAAPGWSLPDGRPIPAAMQVGDVWLSNGGNSAILPAVTHGNAVTFPVASSIDDLLRSADRIQVEIQGSALSITPDRTRLDSLLAHLRQCREAIRHVATAGG